VSETKNFFGIDENGLFDKFVKSFDTRIADPITGFLGALEVYGPHGNKSVG
jgi:hypothetical protein